MKKSIYVTGMVMISIFAGCSRVSQLTNIGVDIPYTQQLTVPSLVGDTAGYPLPQGGASLPFPSFPVPTNSKQYLATYNTAANKIVSFGLKAMQVQILSPSTQKFRFCRYYTIVRIRYGPARGIGSLSICGA